MTFKALSILAISIFFIAGCSTSSTQVESSLVNELDNAPSWVKVQHTGRAINSIGTQKKESLSFTQQRDLAIKNAKENLASSLTLKLTNIFKIIENKNIDNVKYQKRVTQTIQSLVKQSVDNSKTIKLWQSNLETIYVLVSLDIKNLKDSLDVSIHRNFKDFPSINSNYSLALEQGKIDIALLK